MAEAEETDQPYYFESDHVALKENSDYRKLLHTITLLEAQRHQEAQDLDLLYKAQDEAMADPLDFVEKLQKGEKFDFAQPQRVVDLPEIQWEKYTSTVSFTSFGSAWHKTRQKKQQDDGAKDPMQKLLMGESSCTPQSSGSTSAMSDADTTIVRGRAKDKTKSATFNQLWTSEEQQKLELLLLKFPPEEVEARRWSKIASALGNRTPIQVASRVQKYFVSLAKEGLPVPGRMPNLSSHSKRGSHRHHRFNRNYYPSSTMLQSHVPPVWMTDDNTDIDGQPNFPEYSTSSPFPESAGLNTDFSDDVDCPLFEGLQDQPEYKELMELQRLKKEKLQDDQAAGVQHLGYRCDNCSTEPIVGTRWHCIDCPSELSFDFCDACSVLPFQDGKHNSTHRLQPIKNAALDSDYMSHTKSNYNYLDSNYMPGS